MKKFLIVDGNSLANRAFYAMPYLSNIKAQPSGAIFGFANILIKLITEQKPDYIAVAFDHARKTFRNEIYADYKGTRKETPPDLKKQFPFIKEMLSKMGIKVFEQEGIEADDIIGTLSKHSQNQNILLSGDRDLLQLVDENTTVWLTKKGVTELEVMDTKTIKEKYGFAPSGIIELKSLMGDSSDNIPGVSGVGEKTALNLLQTYGDLDGVYENLDKITGKLKEKLENGKENAYLSKKLATIKTDCEIEFNLSDCEYSFPFSNEVREFFEYWNFNSFTKRDDIFGEEKKENNEVQHISVDDISKIDEMIKEIKGEFSYSIHELMFSPNENKVYFLEKNPNLFSSFIDLNEVLKKLKNVFEDEKIEKITLSSKEDMKILKRLGIKLTNFFDLEIARYVCFTQVSNNLSKNPADFFKLKKEFSSLIQEKGVDFVYNNIEIPLVEVLAEMEEKGFKIDEQILDEIDEKISSEIKELEYKIYEMAGEKFNINSPKQVANILFDKLQIVPYNNKKRSTSFAILDELRFDHEIVNLIIHYRKVYKLKSTYINVYKDLCKTRGNVVHTIFNQTLTNTGRLSSSEPNMQNIPTRDEEGKNLRKIFVSKFDGGLILSADYNQIELRLLANMAEENSMMQAYQQGIDIHTKTASEIFNVPIEKVTPGMRRDAKAVNFGIVYGISDYGLSQNIKTSRMKAKIYIDSYFERYPKIKEFMDKNVEFAKENGYAKTVFGRIRMIPELSSSNFNVRKFGERVAMNMPLQGTASDIIKLAMIATFRELKNLESHIILQVHDELVIDVKKEELEKVKEIVKRCMENVKTFRVPLVVNVGVGDNLYDCK